MSACNITRRDLLMNEGQMFMPVYTALLFLGVLTLWLGFLDWYYAIDSCSIFHGFLASPPALPLHQSPPPVLPWPRPQRPACTSPAQFSFLGSWVALCISVSEYLTSRSNVVWREMTCTGYKGLKKLKVVEQQESKGWDLAQAFADT